MFSDRYRKSKIAGLIIILVILAWYSSASRQPLTLDICRKNSDRYDGQRVDVFMEARVITFSDGNLTISQPDGPIDIRVPTGFNGMIPEGESMEEIKPGRSLEAATIFRSPGYLELEKIRIATLRPLKIIISILPALVALIVLVVSLRWENGRLVMKE